MIVAQRQSASSVSLPAPVGGWNARDSIGAMAPTDAVSLENLFPATTDVILRQGYSQWATGITGQVETLIDYQAGAANKFFAAAGSNIYDVTAGGAVGAAVVTTLTNARWQYINITTPGGSWIQCVNGADKMRYFDGTNWHKDGDGAPYDVTGVDTSNVIQINLHQNRVWLIVKNTLKPYYLATQSIGGAATAFDLSAVAKEGGYLMAMGTWTIDAGQGPNDYAAFITSNGEVIVYAGTNPASAATWSLIGVWWLGSPIGRRCFVKWAGDLLLICQDGVQPMSQALQSSRVNPRVALTDKIMYQVSNAITSYGSHFGWQLMPFPKQNMLFLNVPVSEGSQQQQYVMNSITKSWCNFTGWAANCWELHNDFLFFGGNGFVGKAWDTYADNGTNITGNGLQAFNYFGSPGTLKRFTMMRPTIFTDGQPSVGAGLNIDFDLTDTSLPVSISSSSYGIWGTAVWGTSLWGSGSLTASRQWQGVNGIGYCAAPRFKASTTKQQIQWVSTDLVYERGGIL